MKADYHENDYIFLYKYDNSTRVSTFYSCVSVIPFDIEESHELRIPLSQEPHHISLASFCHSYKLRISMHTFPVTSITNSGNILHFPAIASGPKHIDFFITIDRSYYPFCTTEAEIDRRT
ncbi:hypothetical protein QVD17_32843 [Tagetes erecta]|uniref:Uncharacterized protein n=1 Tax=Tagetes erecta TaxID=13708 RepID=A0AAD8K091_TARER|nr:hypothetical protein QVD17_32843 [Tagetes erecta]